MIELLQRVQHYKPSPISPEQFSEWKHDPVTEMMFLELAESFLNQIDEDLPQDSIDMSLIIAHQREGARKMVGVLMDWMPAGGDDDA